MRRSTLVLLALVAALVAAIFFWERHKPTTKEIEENKMKLLDFKVPDVKACGRTGNAPVELVKDSEGDWRLKTPVVDKADRYGVEGFLERLAEVKAIRTVEKSASAKDLGLDPAKALWRLDKPGGPIQIEVGTKAPFDEGLYIRAAGQVALVPADLESLLLKPAADFRSKELLAAASSDVRSFRLSRASGGPLAFDKQGDSDWQIKAPFADWGAGDALQQIVDDVCLCPVFSFVEDSPTDLKKYGLDPAQATIQLGLKKKSVELRLGAEVPGGDPEKKLVYAWASDRPSVMTVSTNSLKSLEKPPEALRALGLFRHDLYDVDSLEVKGIFSATEERDKEKGGWKFKVPDKPPAGADASALPAALLELKGEKAVPASDLASLGLVQPDLTVVAKGKGFEEKVSIGREKDGARYARPEGRPSALLLPKDAWKRIEEALKLVAGSGAAKK